eukprot:m.166120 g.166120  ORF g.166120 m.166120 type:complete len:72 (+) comp24030_c0_seq1:3589-3804(+)
MIASGCTSPRDPSATNTASRARIAVGADGGAAGWTTVSGVGLFAAAAMLQEISLPRRPLPGLPAAASPTGW